MYTKKGRSDTDTLTIIQKDIEFQKPNIRLDAEFELVKIKNGMTGILISAPFPSKFEIQLSMLYGTFIDTVTGLSHIGEHMSFHGSEKYKGPYAVFNIFQGIKGAILNAGASGLFQTYYVSLPFNFLYEKVFDMVTDAFGLPTYNPEILKMKYRL